MLPYSAHSSDTSAALLLPCAAPLSCYPIVEGGGRGPDTRHSLPCPLSTVLSRRRDVIT